MHQFNCRCTTQVFPVVQLVYARAQEDVDLPMAQRRMLDADDLPALEVEVQAEGCSRRVERAWQEECELHPPVAGDLESGPSVLRMIVWGADPRGLRTLALLYLGKICGSLGQPVFF